MLVRSHLHQRFNVTTCSAYIHTLRWTDRPLHCPRCQSHDVSPWGTYHYRPEPALTAVLDSCHRLVVPVVFIPSHRAGIGCPYPHQLSLVLVVAQCCPVL